MYKILFMTLIFTGKMLSMEEPRPNFIRERSGSCKELFQGQRENEPLWFHKLEADYQPLVSVCMNDLEKLNGGLPPKLKHSLALHLTYACEFLRQKPESSRIGHVANFYNEVEDEKLDYGKALARFKKTALQRATRKEKKEQITIAFNGETNELLYPYLNLIIVDAFKLPNRPVDGIKEEEYMMARTLAFLDGIKKKLSKTNID